MHSLTTIPIEVRHQIFGELFTFESCIIVEYWTITTTPQISYQVLATCKLLHDEGSEVLNDAIRSNLAHHPLLIRYVDLSCDRRSLNFLRNHGKDIKQIDITRPRNIVSALKMTENLEKITVQTGDR